MCDRVTSYEKSDNCTMEFPLMRKIIYECSKFIAKPFIHFSGHGEPLCYPEIDKAMKLCYKNKLTWSMTTNAYLLDKYAEDIVLNGCHSLNISIHGIETDHDRITGISGSFKKAIKGIRTIDELKKRSSQTYPLIAINCVFNNENVQNLKQVLDAFIGLPITNVVFQNMMFLKDHLKDKGRFLIQEKEKLEKLISFVDYIKNNKLPVAVDVYPYIKRQDIVGYYTDIDYPFRQSCIIPWVTMRVYPNGDVRLCNQFFGNLRRESFKLIINNKSARRLRYLVRKGKFTSSICFRCCHRQYY